VALGRDRADASVVRNEMHAVGVAGRMSVKSLVLGVDELGVFAELALVLFRSASPLRDAAPAVSSSWRSWLCVSIGRPYV
jgi:hypothetical protein